MYKGCVIFAVLLIAVAGFSQQATTIYEIQSSRNPETQASNWVDSLVTVAGVVTCDYGVTGGYNFFLEMKQGGQWSGIMVYVPGVAGAFAVDVGDSLVVTGSVLEYYDNTELRIDDTTLVERCASPGLPPLAVISTAHLDTATTSPLYVHQPDSAEAYEGVLVQVQNAFVTDEMDANGNWVVSDGSGGYAKVLNPQDESVTYTPKEGDFLNITGIVHTHYGIYKIRPRNDNDIEFLGETCLSFAYSTSRTGINLKFTRDVDASTAGNILNYEIIPAVNITDATVDAEDLSLVHLNTDTQSDAKLCTLIVHDVYDVGENLICDTTTFYSGFVPIQTIQSDTVPGDPEFTTQWDGQRVTITGIITGESEAFYNPAWYWVQQGEGPWSGIMAYHPNHPYETIRGDSVIIVAGISEYSGMTEILGVIYYNVVSSDNTLPAPSLVNSRELNAAIGATAEQWEGVLVKVDSATVVHAGTTPGSSSWYIDDGTGQCIVSNYDAYTYVPANDDVVTVTGVTRYAGGNFYLYPRDDDDISFLFHGVEESTLKHFDIALLSNPVSFSSGVLLTIPEKSSIDLSVYNLAGQRIADIKRGVLEPGVYEFNWDTKEVANGAYFYCLKTKDRNLVRKVVVLK